MGVPGPWLRGDGAISLVLKFPLRGMTLWLPLKCRGSKGRGSEDIEAKCSPPVNPKGQQLHCRARADAALHRSVAFSRCTVTAWVGEALFRTFCHLHGRRAHACASRCAPKSATETGKTAIWITKNYHAPNTIRTLDHHTVQGVATTPITGVLPLPSG